MIMNERQWITGGFEGIFRGGKSQNHSQNIYFYPKKEAENNEFFCFRPIKTLLLVGAEVKTDGNYDSSSETKTYDHLSFEQLGPILVDGCNLPNLYDVKISNWQWIPIKDNNHWLLTGAINASPEPLPVDEQNQSAFQTESVIADSNDQTSEKRHNNNNQEHGSFWGGQSNNSSDQADKKFSNLNPHFFDKGLSGTFKEKLKESSLLLIFLGFLFFVMTFGWLAGLLWLIAMLGGTNAASRQRFQQKNLQERQVQNSRSFAQNQNTNGQTSSVFSSPKWSLQWFKILLYILLCLFLISMISTTSCGLNVFILLCLSGLLIWGVYKIEWKPFWLIATLLWFYGCYHLFANAGVCFPGSAELETSGVTNSSQQAIRNEDLIKSESATQSRLVNQPNQQNLSNDLQQNKAEVIGIKEEELNKNEVVSNGVTKLEPLITSVESLEDIKDTSQDEKIIPEIAANKTEAIQPITSPKLPPDLNQEAKEFIPTPAQSSNISESKRKSDDIVPTPPESGFSEMDASQILDIPTCEKVVTRKTSRLFSGGEWLENGVLKTEIAQALRALSTNASKEVVRWILLFQTEPRQISSKCLQTLIPD